jgi:hypothetical protein
MEDQAPSIEARDMAHGVTGLLLKQQAGPSLFILVFIQSSGLGRGNAPAGCFRREAMQSCAKLIIK